MVRNRHATVNQLYTQPVKKGSCPLYVSWKPLTYYTQEG